MLHSKHIPFSSFVVKNHYFRLAWKNWKGRGERKKKKELTLWHVRRKLIFRRTSGGRRDTWPLSHISWFSINVFTTRTRNRRTVSSKRKMNTELWKERPRCLMIVYFRKKSYLFTVYECYGRYGDIFAKQKMSNVQFSIFLCKLNMQIIKGSLFEHLDRRCPN